MKSLIIMPPLRYTSEMTTAIALLYALNEYNSQIHYILTEDSTLLSPYIKSLPPNITSFISNVVLANIHLKKFSLYEQYLNYLKIKKYKEKNNIDLVFNMYYIEFPLGFDVSYIIYPHAILSNFNELKKTQKKIKMPYLYLNRLLLRKLSKAKKLLCSSSTIKQEIKQIDFDCEIVYPPVIPQETKNQEKQNLIVGVGKYVPSKHWEEFIQIAKKVKQKQPNTKFKIIGGLELVHNSPKDYFSELRKLAGDDVELLTDVSEYDKWRILNSAKIVLHCMRYDNFGLGVAEAMHAGAVPIVYKSSGTWMDIIEEGKYGIGYTSVEEASQEIIKIIEDEKTFKEYSEKAQQKAQQYNIQNFKNKIHNIINQLQ